MKYARIENGKVMETGDFDSIEGRFHHSLVWIECGPEVVAGYSYDGASFAAPPPPTSDDLNSAIKSKIAELDTKRIRPLAEGDTAYLAQLNEQIAALRGQLK